MTILAVLYQSKKSKDRRHLMFYHYWKIPLSSRKDELTTRPRDMDSLQDLAMLCNQNNIHLLATRLLESICIGYFYF